MKSEVGHEAHVTRRQHHMKTVSSPCQNLETVGCLLQRTKCWTISWLPFTVRPICIVGVSNMCTETWKCGGTFSNASRFCPQQSDRLLKYGLTTFEHWTGSFQSLEVEKMVFVDFQWTHMGSTCACCLCESYQHNQTGWFVTNTGWRMGCNPIAVCDQPGNQHEQEMPGYCGCVWFVRMLLKPDC